MQQNQFEYQIKKEGIRAMKTFQKAIDCGLTLVTVGGTLAPVSFAFASEVEKKQSVDKKSRLNDFENVTGAVDE